MKKLMKYISNTMIGRQIKALIAVLLLIICMGCNPEIPLQYDLVLDNRTAAELEIKLYNSNNGMRVFNLPPLSLKRTFHSTDLYMDEEIVKKFLMSWKMGAELYEKNNLMIEWNGPAYYGGNENHFYNINAWEVENSHPSHTIDGTFTFTIYPEDLVQDAIE